VGVEAVMNDEERNTMREHIVWLTKELEDTREQLKTRNELLKEMLNPEELGHAVTQEIRGRIYTILYLQENNK
jgi:shikimate kinase